MTVRSTRRGRSSSFLNQESWGTQTGAPTHGPGEVVHDDLRFSYNWVDSYIGSDDPMWRNKVRLNINAVNPATWTKREFAFGQTIGNMAFLESYGNKPLHVTEVSGCLPDIANSGLVTDSGGLSSALVESDAKIAFLGKVRKVQRQFQGGVFLGELREAIQMVRSPAKALRRGIDDYYGTVKKRTRGMRGPSASDAVAQTWLEYVYGWSPLINDVSAGRDALTKLQPFGQRLQVTVKRKIAGSTTISDGNITPFLRYSRVARSNSEYSVRIRGYVMVDNNRSTAKLRKWGVHSSDLIPTIWELIPYSFLVDYFSNIGKVLDAATTCTSSLRWASKTVRKVNFRENSLRLRESACITAVGGKEYWRGGSLSHSGFANSSVNGARSDVSTTLGVSLNDLHFTFPGMDSRWLNIAALAKLRK